MLDLKVIVEAEIPIVENLPEDYFPFDVGSFTIKSKDGKRSYVVDSILSHRTHVDNPMEKGKNFEFAVNCEVDFESFPEKDYKYDLIESDIKDAVGVFFCNYDDYGDENVKYFDMDNAKFSAIIINQVTLEEHIIPVTLED